ncbi:MAG: choice-of-anchor K domain-containing protein [Microcoleaceae cyanobacterium]
MWVRSKHKNFKIRSFKVRDLLWVVAASTVLGSGNPATATTFVGNSSGSLQLPAGTFGAVLSSENAGTNNRITWGDPTPGSFENYLQYDSSNFTAEIDQLFPLGQLEYRNGEVFSGSHNLNASNFPLAIVLSFSTPLTATDTFNYQFSLLQTVNQGDPVLDADQLSFVTDGSTTNTFNFDGIEYTLELAGFSSDAGNTILSQFILPEEATVSALLYAKLSIVPQQPDGPSVPEPNLLVGLGVLGLYWLGVRR